MELQPLCLASPHPESLTTLKQSPQFLRKVIRSKFEQHMDQICLPSLLTKLSVISLRKLLFVSAIKQIAGRWFQLSSKASSQAVIVLSKPEIYYSGLTAESLHSDYVPFNKVLFHADFPPLPFLPHPHPTGYI